MAHSYRGRDFDIGTRPRRLDFSDQRLRIAKAGLFAFAALLLVRLFILQIIDADTYRALASQQREIYRDLFPERGEILIQDRASGGLLTPLATNRDLYLVYADPRLIDNPEEVAKKLAPLLEIEDVGRSDLRRDGDRISEYQQLIARLSKRDDPYEPLSHGVTEEAMEEIKKLRIIGIDAVAESTRYYPLKNIGAHLAGFVGSDGEKLSGRYGIEGSYEHELAGTPGFFEGEKDIAGRWIPVGKRNLKAAVDGAAIVLNVDRTIEYTACAKLNEAVKKHGAEGGMVIIMDPATGAILAICGAPDFDPNEYGEVDDISVYKNPATSAQYEPGSVFKLFTMAAALDSGEVTPETVYDDTGAIRIGPYTINNADLKKHGAQTMTQVLEKSLNTGAVFAARKVGIERFGDYARRFGFGELTGIELQSEAQGDIESLSKRGEIYLATSSFGQGIAVTPIQLARATSAIANQGKLMQPQLTREIRRSNGVITSSEPHSVREVVTPRTANLLAGMMVSVVEHGHGKRAGVPGYFVAGKTGTAQIPRTDGKGYEPGATIGTFVGFAPVDNPRFVMLTRIDRPKDVQFAESSAAPLFGEIAKFLLQYFEVKPTRPVRER